VCHRTVRCATGQPLFMSGARFPCIPGAADRCNFGLVGAPDSPVPPTDRWSRPHVARGVGGRPLCWRPLAHRTVRCTTGQSGAPPDSPVNYSRTPLKFSREWLVRRRPAWRTGHYPVHHRTVGVPDYAESWLHTGTLFQSFSFPVSST
jgi:hypothetical protein